ncbi:DNA internalization-related competence protein ComEC/Rec2 [Alkalibacterium sp.]
MKGKLVFPAILLLLYVTAIQLNRWSLLILCLALLVKLATWADKSLAYLSMLLIAVSTIQIVSKQDVQLFPELSEVPYVIEVKQTSWKVDGNQLRFQGTVLEEEPKRKIIVNYTIASQDEKKELESKPSSMIVTNGRFKKPFEATNKNLFNYKDYLNKQNVRQILQADFITEVNSLPKVYHRTYFFDSVRMKALKYCDAVFNPITSLYIRALLFADRSALSEEVIQAFRNLGLMHLLSISGLHISLLLSGLNKAALKLRVTRENSILIQIVFLAFYAVFTGLGVSVYRASVQHGVKSVYAIKERFIHTLDCWSIALLSLLFISPVVIFSVGFQLSFLLSFLIIMLSGQPFFNSLKQVQQYAVLNVLLFITSIPVLSFHFFEFSLGALLFNSIYIPFISLILLPGLIMLFILSPFILNTAIFQMFDQLIGELIRMMENVTYSIESTASLVFVSGRLNTTVMIIWGIVLVLLLLNLEKRFSRRTICIYMVLFCLLAFSNRITPFGEIVIIDVGQGDAILIKEPFSRDVTLIDTGGLVSWRELEEWERKENQYSLGSHILAPFVKSMGIKKIDTVLITHLHYDHYGELANMAEIIPVVNIAGTIETLGDSAFHEQLNRMDMEDTVLQVIDQSTGFSLSNRLVGLKDSLKDQDNINNQSIVLLGKYGKLVWMFTGDIESEREAQIQRDYPNLKTDVLKVAHHGSASSTTAEFVEHTKPDYALISAGRNNRYNHPQDEVLLRLKENSVETFRTDYHGSIHYKFSDYRLLDEWVNIYRQKFWTNSSRGDYE